MSASVLQQLLDVRTRRGAGYLTLLDPDRLSLEQLESRSVACADAGADAILVGTSLMLSASANTELFQRLRSAGDVGQVVSSADAILFLSMVSGRNAELLIGQHVRAAPLLKEYGVEVIPTAYMLVESGTLTSVEYMSNTKPIPRSKNDIAMAHALAAQFLGMGLVYLETGSGAAASVPASMIESVSTYVDIPVIVGGGIRDPETAREKVDAGAAFVVTGTAVESDPGRLRELSAAVHTLA
jgi:phosphoglycerol geranylgeranyltransferase